MSTYFLTHIRINEGITPVDMVSQVVLSLRSSADARLARVQFRHGFAWIRVEHLGFYSLKQSAAEEVARLARELQGEVVMFAAQTTAGCAAYAHYVSGALRRFLSAGDEWFEIYGEPEPWESQLFSKEFAWRYAVGEDSPFHDGVVPHVAAYHALPSLDASSIWQIDRGLMDETTNG